MDERLERDLRVGLATMLESVAGSHPTWEGSPAAARVAGAPARRWPSGRLGLLWVAALVALLLAALAATAFVGGWRPEPGLLIVPSPTWTTAVEGDATDILATTKAHPLPDQARCPPGSNPDSPGPAGQDRPTGGPMAFDRHAGRIVLLEGSQTWTFDVCTNSWQRMRATPAPAADRLVYDADSDRTLAFWGSSVTGIYDLASDRWTGVGPFRQELGRTYGTIFYHEPSGLVVSYDGQTMWAHDVDTGATSKVLQRPDPARPAGSGLPEGKIAFGYDPGRNLVVAVVVPGAVSNPSTIPGVPSSPWGETWTFDPLSGAWHLETAPAPSDLIVCSYWRASTDCMTTTGRAVFDEASALPVFITRDNGGAASALAVPGRIEAFDTVERAWRTLYDPTVNGGATPRYCSSMPPVYDPLNGRIVCFATGHEPIGGISYPYAGMAAFSTQTGQWQTLLDPDTTRCDVSTIAGKPGEAGAADGTGAAARFSGPRSIVMDTAGAIYITDTANHAIRKMTPDGTVTTVGGSLGERGSADGAGSKARFASPSGIAVDAAGVLYVADTDNDAIRKVAPDGSVSTLAKGLGISPVGIAVDAGGSVYAGGLRGNVILKVARDGSSTTLVGVKGQPGWTDGAGPAARLQVIIDIKAGGMGDLFVIDVSSDGSRSALRTVSMTPGESATVSTEPGDWPRAGRPGAVWPDPSSPMYFTSSLDNSVMEMSWDWSLPAHPVTLLAGVPRQAGYQDGRRDAARFRAPTDIVRDASGLFYVVDSGNNVIRTMSCTPGTAASSQAAGESTPAVEPSTSPQSP